MPIAIEERYKLIFNEFQYASGLRIKIITGWCAIYAALAYIFAWVHQTVPILSWTVTTLGIAVTLIMWSADCRHRPAIRRCKEVGESIELDASARIPFEQRFFPKLDKGFSHSNAIDIFAIVILLLLLYTTKYLFFSNGNLPTS